MLVYFKGFTQKHVLVIDVEFDQMEPIQVAGMIFDSVEQDMQIFQLSTSFNFYIKKEVDIYTTKYTGMTTEFLEENGMEREEFLVIFKEVMDDYNLRDMVLVAHGAKNDRKVLVDAGVDTLPEKTYCTYKNAKRILQRENNLKLSDIAVDAGLMALNSHNAYNDVITTVSVLSFLLKNDEKHR